MAERIAKRARAKTAQQRKRRATSEARFREGVLGFLDLITSHLVQLRINSAAAVRLEHTFSQDMEAARLRRIVDERRGERG